MRRIVVIAAGMAGITTATRLKRRLPSGEIILVIPAALEKLQAACKSGNSQAGPAARRLADALPDMVRLPTRKVGIVEAQDIMPDLAEKEVTVTSARGSVTLRYSDLVLEVPATVRLPRALQRAENVFSWPMPGFSAKPEEYDRAMAGAAGQDLPVVVVGNGVAALDATLLACEAGARVCWLQTGETDVPDMDPLLLQLALNALGSRVTRIRLPDNGPERLDFRVSADGGRLESLVTPDGTSLQSPCFIWTAPLMGRHPILREAGVSLDAFGRLRTDEDGPVRDLFIMGSGSAVPPALLPGTGQYAPVHPGCDDYADASAVLCLENLLGEDTLYSDAGSFGTAAARGEGLCLLRAGYSMLEAARAELEAEYAVTSFADAGSDAPSLVLNLVCSKQSRRLIGAQVLGMGRPGATAVPAFAEGLFGMCVAALAEGSAIDALSSRPYTGLPGKLLSRAASVLCNKLVGRISGITPEELLASHEAGAEFFTLDLRPLHVWQEGHVPKAYNIPLLQLKKRLQNEVPHFTPLVLVSEDGTDAYAAACKLAALGASSLYVLDGGMRVWPYGLERE